MRGITTSVTTITMLCACTVNRSSACWPSVASSVSIARLPEHRRRQPPQRAFVFGDQDRAAAALGLRRERLRRRRAVRRRVVGARQQQRERGALAGRARRPRSRRRSASRSRRPSTGRARCPPLRLGGEERLEDARLHVRRHADAGVAHAQLDERARRRSRARCACRRRRSSRFAVSIASLPPSRHRVARVEREVDHHLFELRRVGAHRPQVAARAADRSRCARRSGGRSMRLMSVTRCVERRRSRGDRICRRLKASSWPVSVAARSAALKISSTSARSGEPPAAPSAAAPSSRGSPSAGC